MGNSVGQGSIGLSPKADGGGVPVIPTLQQVTTAGNVTTVQSLFNGGIRITIAGTALKLGVTNSDFRSIASTAQFNHGAGDNGVIINRASNDGNGANFQMFKTRSTSASGLVSLQDSDIIGTIAYNGVASNNITTAAVGSIIMRGYPFNTAGVAGAGVPPANVVAGLYDIVMTNIAGTSRNYFRIWPNGEICLVSQNAGTVIPRLNGMMLQVYGAAAIQTGLNVGAIANNAASAILEVNSTTQGVLPARMTNAQRAAIAAPAVGLEVYCTDAPEGKYINTSTGWQLQTPIVLSATVTLTNAEILGLNTTYKEIVPAPGAGLMINLVSAVLKYDISVAYTNVAANSAVMITYSDHFLEASTLSNSPTLTGELITVFPPSSRLTAHPLYTGYSQSVIDVSDISNHENLPLKLIAENSTGDFTGGDAANTATITVYYTITNI